MDFLEFDEAAARPFRKTAEVLAFRCDDPATFDKSWGKQSLKAGDWLLIVLDAAGQPTGDIHGCDAGAFDETYVPSESGIAHRYRKKSLVWGYQPGTPFTVRTEIDGHVEGPASQGDAEAWVVRNPGGEIYPIDDATFRSTYSPIALRPLRAPIRRRHRDEHLRADGTPKRILCLDGGGARGIITVAFLRHLERTLRERYADPDLLLCDYFDLIAGTSTGAIQAAGLAVGMSADELTTVYRSIAGDIFGKKNLLGRFGVSATYDISALQQALDRYVGSHRMNSEGIHTGVLVVTKRLDTGSVWPLANNPFDAYWDTPEGQDWLGNGEYALKQVVRASTAAPTYFEPERIEIARRGTQVEHGLFVDGGVSPHNNPTLQALQLATLDGYGLRWPMGPDNLLVVSIGTGTGDPKQAESSVAAMHGLKALSSLMDDCAQMVEAMMQWMSLSPTARRIDGAVQQLERDLLGDRAVCQYVRYDVYDDKHWLPDNLGRDLTPAERLALTRMDKPEDVPILDRLAEEAAARLVKSDHLPEWFDPIV